MWHIGTAFTRITGIIALIVLVWWLWVMVLAISQGYSWQEMDWNNDGQTTLMEVWDSAEVGRSETQKHGKACSEYFHFKDGVPFKSVCKR
jgi:hypothetical protein